MATGGALRGLDRVVAAAGLDRSTLSPIAGHDRVWRLGADVVLRVGPAVAGRTAWLHSALARIATVFAVPAPVGLLSGLSWWQDGDVVWEALSFVRGDVVGFEDTPRLELVGEFLASFHLAAVECGAGDLGPRPGGWPMADLRPLVDRRNAPAALGSRAALVEFSDRLDRHHRDLTALHFDAPPRTVVHGDPTTFNIVAAGNPRRPCGLIDFELADLEPPVVDIACCLWRSGRPSQSATHLDLDRITALVRGYQAIKRATEAMAAS